MDTQTTPEVRSVFPEGGPSSHMPFFDGNTLVFSQSGSLREQAFQRGGSIWQTVSRNPALAERFEGLPKTQQITFRAWKLAYCDWNDKLIRPLITGLPEDGVECSPAFYKEDGKIYLSFVGGTHSKSGLTYKLYTASGVDLAHMEPAKPLPNLPVFFGFVSPHHVCWGIHNTLRITEKATGNTFTFETSFGRVVRASFLASDPSKLLITGLNADRTHATVIYDLSTEGISDVSVCGDVYKSSIYEDQIIFARTTGQKFESRELCHGAYTLSPSAIKINKR
jgi:hypothetical protein